MKQKVYIETSVVSYLTARPSKDLIIAGHQAATRDFWELLSQLQNCSLAALGWVGRVKNTGNIAS